MNGSDNIDVLDLEIEACRDSIRDLEFQLSTGRIEGGKTEAELVTSRRRAYDRLRHLRVRMADMLNMPI